jgi:ankyrin repeat protein
LSANAVQAFFEEKPSRIKKKWRPLHIAAKMGLLSLCKHIVEKTNDSSSGNSLMMAADGRNIEVAQFLLENNREVNLQNYQDPYKVWTPLHYAANKGHFDIFNC